MNTVVDSSIAKEVSSILLSIKAVTINTEKPYRFVSGMLSPMYTDNRLLISHPTEWKRVIEIYERIIKNNIGLGSIDVLSGTATAAIPHAAALAIRLGKPMVYVRSSKKEHGKENLIEGEFPPRAKVLVIEDLISTGLSSKQSVDAIRSMNGDVATILAITTSTRNAFDQTMTDLKVRLMTLTNADITVQTALEEGLITEKQKDSVDTFFDDAKSWGKLMGFE